MKTKTKLLERIIKINNTIDILIDMKTNKLTDNTISLLQKERQILSFIVDDKEITNIIRS